MRKVIAIIQAHMSSSRLPGKIMKPFCGEPALYRLIERIRQSELLSDFVIATSTLPCDDIIVEKCDEWGVHTFRGSDSDVLARYWGAAQKYPADAYVRITSDCPCFDARWADKTIQYFLDNDYRYVSNAVNDMKPTIPMGFGLEVFEASLLDEAYAVMLKFVNVIAATIDKAVSCTNGFLKTNLQICYEFVTSFKNIRHIF